MKEINSVACNHRKQSRLLTRSIPSCPGLITSGDAGVGGLQDSEFSDAERSKVIAAPAEIFSEANLTDGFTDGNIIFHNFFFFNPIGDINITYVIKYPHTTFNVAILLMTFIIFFFYYFFLYSSLT